MTKQTAGTICRLATGLVMGLAPIQSAIAQTQISISEEPVIQYLSNQGKTLESHYAFYVTARAKRFLSGDRNCKEPLQKRAIQNFGSNVEAIAGYELRPGIEYNGCVGYAIVKK